MFGFLFFLRGENWRKIRATTQQQLALRISTGLRSNCPDHEGHFSVPECGSYHRECGINKVEILLIKLYDINIYIVGLLIAAEYQLKFSDDKLRLRQH